MDGFVVRFWIRKGTKFSFSGFGPEFVLFLTKRFEVHAFRKGYNGFEVRFWRMNLGSSEFEVRSVKFKAGRSLLNIPSLFVFDPTLVSNISNIIEVTDWERAISVKSKNSFGDEKDNSSSNLGIQRK